MEEKPKTRREKIRESFAGAAAVVMPSRGMQFASKPILTAVGHDILRNFLEK